MKANIAKLLETCVDTGVDLGFIRAHKHTDCPDDELIKNEIRHAIYLELYEWFIFEEKQNDC
jgi:hypothetical protein